MTSGRATRIASAFFRPCVALCAVSCVTVFEAPLSTRGAVLSPSSFHATTDGLPTSPMDRKALVGHVFPREEPAAQPCFGQAADTDFVDCLLRIRFTEDPEALELARRLHAATGLVAGVEPSRVMDDGDYRGRVHVEPALPIGPSRRHLQWILDSLGWLAQVLDELQGRSVEPVKFPKRPRGLRFCTTTNTTTPSAYVLDGVITYNLRGELNTSTENVFETLVHELFHVSDGRDDEWSKKTLTAEYESIRRRCGVDAGCLSAYAPHETRVDGGVFYAFHPTSDVREYGAEPAARYVREQRLRMLAPERAGPAFKCLAPENLAAWRAIGQEFFGSVDLVPPC